NFLNLLNLSMHRGPHSQGYINTDFAQLGVNELVRNLSVMERQVFESPGKRFVFVLDGLYYNTDALLNVLKSTDKPEQGELLGRCFEILGIVPTISMLDGMFALIIYDRKTHTLILARDFAGIKPLFYGRAADTWVCSSQYDQLMKYPSFQNKNIDPEVLKLYLKQHFMPAPFGLYEDTFQVLPGEIVSINLDGGVKKERYWELKDDCKFDITNSKEAELLISEALENSIQSQFEKTPLFGAFISGGVDSPLVCSFLKEYSSSFPVYTMGSDSKTHDESERASKFAQALGLPHHLLRLIAEDVAEKWDEAMKAIH